MFQPVEVVLYEMRERRSPATFNEFTTTTTQHFDDHKLMEIKVPRTHKSASRYTGPAAAYAPATITDHFRPLMFDRCCLSFIDAAVAATEVRFTKKQGSLGVPTKLENVLIVEEDDEIRQILSPYTEIDLQPFSTEIRMFP